MYIVNRMSNYAHISISTSQKDLELFKWREKQRTLSSQIFEDALSKFLKEIPINQTENEFVRFGDTVNLIVSDMQTTNDSVWALSISLSMDSFKCARKNADVKAQKYLSVASMNVPCIRNTFRIVI